MGPGLELPTHSWAPRPVSCLPPVNTAHRRKGSSRSDRPRASRAGLDSTPGVQSEVCLRTLFLPVHGARGAHHRTGWHRQPPNLKAFRGLSQQLPEQCQRQHEMPGLCQAMSKSCQQIINSHPLPEPIRALNTGICLCMLTESPASPPVLQKRLHMFSRDL